MKDRRHAVRGIYVGTMKILRLTAQDDKTLTAQDDKLSEFRNVHWELMTEALSPDDCSTDTCALIHQTVVAVKPALREAVSTG